MYNEPVELMYIFVGHCVSYMQYCTLDYLVYMTVV